MRGATYLGICILACAVLIAASVMVVGRYSAVRVLHGSRGFTVFGLD